MAMKQARNVDKCNSFDLLIAAEGYIVVSPIIFAHFKLGGHEPEVVISYYLRHSAGPSKDLFYSFHIR